MDRACCCLVIKGISLFFPRTRRLIKMRKRLLKRGSQTQLWERNFRLKLWLLLGKRGLQLLPRRVSSTKATFINYQEFPNCFLDTVSVVITALSSNATWWLRNTSPSSILLHICDICNYRDHIVIVALCTGVHYSSFSTLLTNSLIKNNWKLQIAILSALQNIYDRYVLWCINL